MLIKKGSNKKSRIALSNIGLGNQGVDLISINR